MWLAITLLAVATFLIYQLLKPSKDYWEEYGVPQINNASLLDKIKVFFGLRTTSDNDHVAYEQMGSGKFCGLVELQQATLLVKDVDIVKKILIKDFDYFADRRTFASNKSQNIGNKMLFNLSGEEWKGVRNSLSPTFTTGKIRRMMEHFNNVSSEWIHHLKEEVNKAPQQKLAVDVQKQATSFTVDAIASAVFGMSAGTIGKPESIFARMATQLNDISVIRIVKFVIAVTFPRLVQPLGINIFDHQSLLFFENILSQNIKSRMEGKEKRNDFIQLLVEARKGELKSEGTDELNAFEKDAQLKSDSGKKNYLNDDETTNAQALSFFFAGFSTTSNFIGFALYVLALNQEVQDKLREEVSSQLFGEGNENKMDYDKLNGLTYMDMFVSEVNRMYPAIGRLERVCVKDYHDPSENLRVPKGALVGIPIQSIHHDKQYYDHPDIFYPEHFTPENKAKRSPYAYLPFGSGPRNCIGMRFALVESKAAIAQMVHNFVIEPTAKTPVPVQVKSVGFSVQIPDNLELSLRLAS